MKITLSLSRNVPLPSVGKKIAIKDAKDLWFIGKVTEIGKRIVVRFNTGRIMKYKLTDAKWLIPVTKGSRTTAYTDSEIEALKTDGSPSHPNSTNPFVKGGKWVTQPTITQQGAEKFLAWYESKEPLPQFKLLTRKVTDIRVISTCPPVGNKFYLLLGTDGETLFWNDIPPVPSVNYPELTRETVKTISAKVSRPLLRRELGKIAWEDLKGKPEASLYKEALLQDSTSNKFASRYHKFLYSKYTNHSLTEEQYVKESFAECCRFYDDLHLVPQQGPVFKRLFLLLT